ncbi:MAG: hypothetical protein GY918_04860 [Gammaproteobacteria bacterium]|nr:hypothetical protein [Gammaproteobacteria bacterium]
MDNNKLLEMIEQTIAWRADSQAWVEDAESRLVDDILRYIDLNGESLEEEQN